MPQQLSLYKTLGSQISKFPSSRYQGSKLKFVDWIWECIKDLQFHTVFDAFGGTGSVAYMLKKKGKEVTYNDILPFNYYIGTALIENNNTYLDESDIEDILKRKDVDYPDFIEKTFHDIYYTDEENRWLDQVCYNIRNIEDKYKQAMAYFALFQSCIIKRPYNLFHRKNLYIRTRNVERSFGNKKTWDTPFSVHFLKFVEEANNAVFDNNKQCKAINRNTSEITDKFDLVYIDTPYINSQGHGVDYADFYHFLNGIVNYDNWQTMIDYKSNHLRLQRQYNEWNDIASIYNAFGKLFDQFKDSILVISYRSNGFPLIEELEKMLMDIGKSVQTYYSHDFKYVLSNKVSNEVLIVAK